MPACAEAFVRWNWRRSKQIEGPLWLFLSLVFQFLDKSFPDAIAACEETTPRMFVTPEIVSSLGVSAPSHNELRGPSTKATAYA